MFKSLSQANLNPDDPTPSPLPASGCHLMSHMSYFSHPVAPKSIRAVSTPCTPPPNKCGCRRQFPYFQSRVPVTFLTKVFLPGEKHFLDRKDKINTDALTYIHSKHSKLKKKELPTSLLTRCVFTMRGKKSAY